MSSSWSAQWDVAPESSRLLIERAHDELLAGTDAERRLNDVRSLVRESWRRSMANLVGAEALPPLEFDERALAAYRSAHPLAGVMDMVRALLVPSADSGVVVAVGDAAGRLLWVEGDTSVRTLTGDVGFVAGANWSESAVGTSAPGTALQLGRSVQIRGAEHFNRLVQPWSCTAAPVHDPETHRLLGVIDVTGRAEAATPQARLLVDATARAIESEVLVARLRSRADRPRGFVRSRNRVGSAPTASTLRVLGRDRALLEIVGPDGERIVEVSARHADILLMLATHRQGLSAERLAELVYGPDATDTLRPEMVRLRRMLERTAPHLVPLSRPYRLPAELETDAQQVASLLDRGAHRVALAAYSGPVLPDSCAPGTEEVRDRLRGSLREALLAEASVEVLLAYVETDEGTGDAEVLRLCLRLLPARSPKRAGIVARLTALGNPDE